MIKKFGRILVLPNFFAEGKRKEQVEQTAKRYKIISESTAFMLLLTLLSGYLNAYTYATRGGIFANMHTGNMTKLGIGLASGNVAGSWQYLAPILAAVLGVVFSELVRHRFSGIGFGSWQKNMLALEILMLVGSAFVATGWHDMLMACLFSFATEAQLAVFGKWEGRGHAATICTGNIRNLGQYLYAALSVHDHESLRIAGLYFVMVFSFAAGAGLGVLLCGPMGTFGSIPAALGFAILLGSILREEHARN